MLAIPANNNSAAVVVAVRNCGILLTPEFTPVIARLYQLKPFKRLFASACSGTRLKPGVNEMTEKLLRSRQSHLEFFSVENAGRR